MRKEDRIRQQAQTPPAKPDDKTQRPRPEEVKGQASGERQDRPPRKPGALPIPD